MDSEGNVALPFNTRVMHRAVKRGDDEIETAIWA